ncbi:DUF6286 domain-containing protein [Microbacterium sp. SORGH_AS_0888]|uniref:DUF6286 domain-containing protein n=1 Tax=Microbacterium sp. SORGH_AS_0888 TaxID=3041791 RepID=UPI002786A1D6|nr:DUF6286 domain-containing protein [Microbacterium sp. SORGH_AS_0888]MDQ1131200.1 hypothetical protein [Microbacterium sp. SORGH_AS_0888]
MTERALRAAERRMLYRSRSAAVTVALVILVIAAAYGATEAVLAALGQPPLLRSPADTVRLLATDDVARWIAIGALGVAGIAALVAALTPGSRHRRRVHDERFRAVVDDDVIAGSASRVAATVGAVPSAHVLTRMSRRQALVEVRPTTGFPVEQSTVTDAVARDLAELSLRPAPRVRVAVATKGTLS